MTPPAAFQDARPQADAMPRWPALLAYGALFVLPLIPYVLFVGTRGYWAYTNGWDEEHYLSYQASSALMDVPGYLNANLIVLLHELGISGGVQNFLFDALVPILTFLLVAGALARLGIERAWARVYAALLLYGTLLFNQSNPWVEWLNAQGIPWMVSAVGRYPPLFRSPNPQLSFLLAALGLWLYVRYRRWWLLLLPVPPMYWAVGIAYVYGVVAAGLYAWWRPRGAASIAALVAVPFLAIGAAASVAFALLRHMLRGFDATRFAQPSVTPLLPIPLLFVAVALAAALWSWRIARRDDDAHDGGEKAVDVVLYGNLACAACLVLLANLHLFVGVGLNPPGIQDAVGVAVAAVALALAIEAVRRLAGPTAPLQVAGWWPPAFRGALLLLLVWMLALSQGFQPEQRRFRVYVGPPLAPQHVARMRADPLGAVVPHQTLRGRLTLIAPRIRAVPLAHEYNKNGLILQCSGYQVVMARAMEFAAEAFARGELTEAEYRELQAAHELFRSRVALLARPGYTEDERFCPPERPGSGFYVVDVQEGPIWRWLPRR